MIIPIQFRVYDNSQKFSFLNILNYYIINLYNKITRINFFVVSCEDIVFTVVVVLVCMNNLVMDVSVYYILKELSLKC